MTKFRLYTYISIYYTGVVWGIWGAINGVGDGIQSLKELGKSLMFLSNNSVRTEANYLEKFQTANVHDITMVATFLHIHTYINIKINKI